MSLRSNPYERGQKAKRAGRLLESNPFERRAGNANRRRANEWALGWHSVDARARVADDWVWPQLVAWPKPQAGDYDRRERGLEKLFRPTDPLEWEILRAEMVNGVAVVTWQWAIIPYEILRNYAESKDDVLGQPCDEEVGWGISHPMRYFYSALRHQNTLGGWYPPLVSTAYEELLALREECDA